MYSYHAAKIHHKERPLFGCMEQYTASITCCHSKYMRKKGRREGYYFSLDSISMILAYSYFYTSLLISCHYHVDLWWIFLRRDIQNTCTENSIYIWLSKILNIILFAYCMLVNSCLASKCFAVIKPRYAPMSLWKCANLGYSSSISSFFLERQIFLTSWLIFQIELSLKHHPQVLRVILKISVPWFPKSFMMESDGFYSDCIFCLLFFFTSSEVSYTF